MTFFTGPKHWTLEHQQDWEYASRYGMADTESLDEQFFLSDRAAEQAPLSSLWGPADGVTCPSVARSVSNDSRVHHPHKGCALASLKKAA